jgi:hypothetical protein
MIGPDMERISLYSLFPVAVTGPQPSGPTGRARTVTILLTGSHGEAIMPVILQRRTSISLPGLSQSASSHGGGYGFSSGARARQALERADSDSEAAGGRLGGLRLGLGT